MADGEDKSGDLLLFIGAGAVVCMGLAWLVIEAPWSAPAAESDLPVLASAVAIESTPLPQLTDAIPEPGSESRAAPASDPLRLARLALEADMLLEPAEYSAWTLFGEAVTADPGNEAARAGLDEVAIQLLGRGSSALEQGRYDDATAMTDTILARLPDHAGARKLEADIAEALAPPPPPPPAPRRAAPAPRPVDPIPALNDAFYAAMAANNVLTPPGSSAIDLVREMLDKSPGHELTAAARDMLVTEMLDRSTQSIEARDITAAQTWIDAAAPIAADPARVGLAQERITAYLIAAETQKLLPASDFVQTNYVAPEYPRVALDRGVEGWVDVEFVITERGETESIKVVEASNDRYFHEEAVAAVEQWRFEPDSFMDRPIARRSFARLAFVLD